VGFHPTSSSASSTTFFRLGETLRDEKDEANPISIYIRYIYTGERERERETPFSK
jgi:hypothetical protein